MIKVLLVEDDPMVIQLTKSFIDEVNGFSVIAEHHNGLSALEFLKTNSADLIVADISMPKMDGLTFIKELRKKQINSDIIFVTASNDTETIQTALKYGAVDYLVKPYEYERFIRTMESFKKRFKTLHLKNHINQTEIDNITDQSLKSIKKELPKGIHPKTLNKITNNLDQIETEFNVEDFSHLINMSTVSLRHYMDYLCEIGLIESDIEYGSVGRPKYIYRKITKKKYSPESAY